MLALLQQFHSYIGPLNLFRYLTFRTGGAIATALFFVMFFGPRIIAALRIKQGKGQPIRNDGPQSHLAKRGTPTMGGLMILSGLIVTTLLWAKLDPYVCADIICSKLLWSKAALHASLYVLIVMFVTIGFGLIGFYDDYLKVTKQSHNGLSGRARLGIETIVAALACLAMMWIDPSDSTTSLYVPFIKEPILNLSWFFPLFGALVIVAAGNAVNLTDGLDGLAIVPVMIAAATFGLIAYLAGNVIFASYLGIEHINGSGELLVVCGALIGAGLGFLWFNAPPAQIFMGDTGSLALGGLLGTISVAIKHEVVLVIDGGLFVLEALSVIVQVASFKMTGKRVFRMAPIHHHFEQLGWSESQVVVRFWIVSVVLALVGLASLKLR